LNYVWLLFSTKGRINRARYWLAVLIILCWMVFALLSLAIISAFSGIATGPLTIDIVGVSASFDLDPDAAVKVALFPQVVTSPDRLRELEFVRRGAGPSAGPHVKRGHE
jgi:uncharacterized membrane protein YhaH (DUF805 family)